MSTESLSVLAFMRAKFTERAFRPYALAVGQAALAWNDLHEHLGRLLGEIVPSESRMMGLGIWHSSQSDRQKRAMLAGAFEHLPEDLTERYPKLKEDVAFILRAAEGLEDRRNNAVHVPLHMQIPQSIMERPHLTKADVVANSQVRPLHWGGNKRAARLVAKDILVEYRACRNTAVALRDFLYSIAMAMDERAKKPWPERPRLPRLRQKERPQEGRQAEP